MRTSILLAAAATVALTTTASPLLASGFSDPIVEPDIIVADTESSDDSYIVPLMVLVLILVTLASRDRLVAS